VHSSLASCVPPMQFATSAVFANRTNKLGGTCFTTCDGVIGEDLARDSSPASANLDMQSMDMVRSSHSLLAGGRDGGRTAVWRWYSKRLS